MEERKDYRALTSLKGLFILVIVLHNTLSVTPLFSSVPGISFIRLFGGTLGNSMFFILSGFLLSTGYRRRIEEHSIPFGDYLLRRLKKLYPMYILSNAVALIQEFSWYGVSAINIKKMVFTALLIRSPYNNPTWFLCALFACYILYYFFCHAAKSATHYVVYMTLAVIAGYTLIGAELEILFLRSVNGIAYMNFFLGCLLAEVYPLISRKLHRWLQPLFLVLVPALLVLMLSYGVEIISGDVNVCFSFVLCPMVLYLALAEGPCAKLLRWKPLVALGNISSSIFFWHLVLYFVFYDVCAAVTGGGSLREPQYLLYFVTMIVFSAVVTRLGKGK